MFFSFFLWIIFELLYCYNLSLENFIKSAFLTFFRCAADRAPRPNKRSSCLQIQVPIVSGTVRTGQRNRSSCGKWFRARGHFWPYLRTYAPEAWGNLYIVPAASRRTKPNKTQNSSWQDMSPRKMASIACEPLRRRDGSCLRPVAGNAYDVAYWTEKKLAPGASNCIIRALSKPASPHWNSVSVKDGSRLRAGIFWADEKLAPNSILQAP